jgi:polysaccharide biosynthesis/export protein
MLSNWRLASQTNNGPTGHGKTMSLRKYTQIFAALLLMLPALCSGQEPRPAVIPLSTGSGTGGAGATSGSLGAAAGGSYGGLSDGPITPGEAVHINVFNAPDFSITTRVSESGDVPYPILGVVHLGGLTSISAAELLAKELKDRNLLVNPDVSVTVESTSTGITLLGEVHSPGIYPPPGKHMLSDLLAAAGGLTANTGRVIEISNDRAPGHTTFLSWDPTMHNTDNFDRPVFPGDRVLVRACGIAYVGGNVVKAGAYSLCGSQKITLSELIALAGGVAPLSKLDHTYLVRTQPDGTKVVEQIDVKKVLTSRVSDPLVQEDDIIYVSPSPLKAALRDALAFALEIAPAALYNR